MGFNQTQWVTDALITTQTLSGEWGFLLLLARYADQQSSTFAKGRAFCASKLKIGDRQVGEYFKRWRERGVLEVMRHGGGPTKTPGVWRINRSRLVEYQIAYCRSAGLPPPTVDGKPPELSAESDATPAVQPPKNKVDLDQWKQDFRRSGRISGR